VLNQVLCHEDALGSGGIASRILDLSNIKWSVSRPGRFTPGGRVPGIYLGRKLGEGA